MQLNESTNPGFKKVKALHPHWSGTLRLYDDGRLLHEEVGSTAKYELKDDVIIVRWDKWGQESFYRKGDVFIQETMRSVDLGSLFSTTTKGEEFEITRIHIALPEHCGEIALRLGMSDRAVFQQVFVNREYETDALPAEALTILDLGANIGLASLFLGLRYPKARIVFVEPDQANFALAVQNTQTLGLRIQGLNAAVWSEDGTIRLHSQDEEGSDLTAWGYQTSARTSGGIEVPAITIPTLLAKAGISEIDILKVDIEGAEVEMLITGNNSWLTCVKMVMIETHDSYKANATAIVREALAGLFDELPPSGENLIFRRSTL